ncbi:MAG: hypothetical protein LBN00_06495 [Oscillospiraceae bacterium]|jgi:3D (Asp-Asp-Asp) domain-containing protein|nr:hypothetical protein [Oscillospiraceae bacterium]
MKRKTKPYTGRKRADSQFVGVVFCCIVAIAAAALTTQHKDVREPEPSIAPTEQVTVKYESPAVATTVAPIVTFTPSPEQVEPTPEEPEPRTLTAEDARRGIDAYNQRVEEDWGVYREGMTYLGEYKIVGYNWTDPKQVGKKKADGITKSGVQVTVGRTVAMKDLPFGTVIYIDGLGEYVVEDRGVGDAMVDIAFDNDKDCFAVTSNRDVWVVTPAGGGVIDGVSVL